jgi:hypothetical protein
VNFAAKETLRLLQFLSTARAFFLEVISILLDNTSYIHLIFNQYPQWLDEFKGVV